MYHANDERPDFVFSQCGVEAGEDQFAAQPGHDDLGQECGDEYEADDHGKEGKDAEPDDRAAHSAKCEDTEEYAACDHRDDDDEDGEEKGGVGYQTPSEGCGGLGLHFFHEGFHEHGGEPA